MKVAFQLKYGSRVQRETQTSDMGLRNSASHAGLRNSCLISNAGLSNSASHASLSNSASYFKHGSEQLRVLTETSMFTINNTRSASIVRLIFRLSLIPITRSINFPYNGGVNSHYGGILGDNYTPWLLINSLKSYDWRRTFGEFRKRRLLEIKSWEFSS